jgi:tetratricopeptide (TPR) repeat protein
LLIVVATALVAVVGVHFLHAFQLRRTADDLLELADQAEKNGQPDQFEQFLWLYLYYVPDNLDVQVRYGLVLADKARTRKSQIDTYLFLQNVSRRYPERLDILPRLADLAIKLGRFDEARAHLKVLLAANAADARAAQLYAECEQAAGNYDTAEDRYARAIKLAPDKVGLYERRAELLAHRLDRSAEADKLLDDMVSRNFGSFQAYLVRCRFRQKQAKLDLASQDIAKAKKLAPDDTDVLLMSAELARARKQVAAARADLTCAIEKHPDDVRFYYQLARLDFEDKRPTEALTCLRKSLGLSHTTLDLWNSAELLLDLGATEDAQEMISRLEKSGSLRAQTDYLIAHKLVSEKDWAAAGRALDKLIPTLSQIEGSAELQRRATSFLVACYSKVGSPELEVAACRQAVQLDPNWSEARLGLADALARLGRIDEALDEYRKLPNSADAGLAIVRLSILRNLQLPVQRRSDWKAIEAVLNKFQPSVATTILRAELQVDQGQLAEARRLLETERAKQPTEVDLWVALSGLALRENDPKKALETLQEAAKKLGSSPKLHLAYVRYWQWRAGPEALKGLKDLEPGLAGFRPEDASLVLYALATAHVWLNHNEDAQRLLSQLAKLQKDDLRVQMLLFDLAYGAKDKEGMTAALAALQRIEGPGGPLWGYGQAVLLLTKAGQSAPEEKTQILADARNHLAQILNRRPSWSRAWRLTADLEEAVGNQDAALQAYLQAVEHGERELPVIRRCVQLLYERQRFQDADHIINKLVAENQAPISGELARLAIQVSLGNNDSGRAEELARKAVESHSKDYQDYIWYAQILSEGSKLPLAITTLRDAVERFPKLPACWILYVQFLARSRQMAEAETAIGRMQKQLDPAQLPLALTQCYEAVGHLQQAEQQLMASLAAKPDAVDLLFRAAEFYLRSAQSGKAKQLLQRLIDQPKVPAGTLAWARRGLAMLLAADGRAHLKDALDQLDRNLAADKDSIEDSRTKAFILTAYPDRAPEAIALLEGLRSRKVPLKDDDLFLLAHLYDSNNDWSRASEYMLNLVTGPKANPNYLAYYAGMLLARDEPTEAERWVARLEQLEPKAPRTYELKAKCLHRLGDDTKAVELLEQLVKDHPDALFATATLLDRLNQPKAAEEMYRRASADSKDPERRLVLAEFLSRQGNLTEALQLCDRAWQTCQPGAVATVMLTVLRQHQAPAGPSQQLERRIRAELGKQPQNLALRLSLAHALDLQGQFPEAKVLYQQVLERDPGNVVALNNLAWLRGFEEGGAEEGLKLVDQALALAGRQNMLLDTRGVLLLKVGRVNEAVTILGEATRRAPAGAVRVFHLAQAHWQAKDLQSARIELQRAIQLGLKETDVHPLEHDLYNKLRSALSP